MEVILDIIKAILNPLSLGLVFTSILAGICLGVFYNYPLNIDARMVFHKAVAGWIFIMFIFVYRVVTQILDPTLPIPQFLGWIGIGILWGIFCLSIYLTDKAAEEILFRLAKVKK